MTLFFFARWVCESDSAGSLFSRFFLLPFSTTLTCSLLSAASPLAPRIP